MALGIIPTYQFSADPSVNPFGVNPHVQFPAGMSQLTVQPVGLYPTSGDASLGTPMVSIEQPPVGVAGVFETSWWQNRKWLAFGALGLLGIGIVALATKTLR